MDKKEKIITLRCTCAGRCAMLVIDKDIWDKNDISYSISMQDSSYDASHTKLFGRLKNACKMLFEKPIHYNDIYIDDLQKFNNFVNELVDLEKWDGERSE